MKKHLLIMMFMPFSLFCQRLDRFEIGIDNVYPNTVYKDMSVQHMSWVRGVWGDAVIRNDSTLIPDPRWREMGELGISLAQFWLDPYSYDPDPPQNDPFRDYVTVERLADRGRSILPDVHISIYDPSLVAGERRYYQLESEKHFTHVSSHLYNDPDFGYGGTLDFDRENRFDINNCVKFSTLYSESDCIDSGFTMAMMKEIFTDYIVNDSASANSDNPNDSTTRSGRYIISVRVKEDGGSDDPSNYDQDLTVLLVRFRYNNTDSVDLP